MITTLWTWKAGLALEGYTKSAVCSSDPLGFTRHYPISICSWSLVLGFSMTLEQSLESSLATPCFRCPKSTLEDVLRAECDVKPTSHLYTHLLLISLPALDGLRAQWQRDIPDLCVYDWEGIWALPFWSLVSLRDRLIQFKIVYRAYFTSYRLNKMKLSHPPTCWRCGDPLGDFSHSIWYSPAVTGF